MPYEKQTAYCHVEATCKTCSSVETAVVPINGVMLYKHGALIQKAFPDEDADTREIIMASLNNSYFLCPSCWETTFPEEPAVLPRDCAMGGEEDSNWT